jgi:hypothetical protein
MRNRNRGDIEHLSYGDFKIQLQKNAWSTVFNKMNMDKYMTAKLKEKISKFVEEQSETPFTRKNIYNMLQFVYDTNSNRMDDVLVEVFDTLTQHYDENRFHVEGWKTNSHYMINEKFIIPYMTKLRHGGGIEVHWNGNGNKVDDLTKALCYLTGQNYDDYLSLENWVSRVRIKDEDYYRNNADVRSRAESQFKHYSTDWRTAKEFNKKWTKETYIESCIETAIEKCEHYERREFGKWYDWGFFEVKGFKKGTMHFKFKDRKVWEFFNVRVGEIKGYELPESFCRKWDSPIKEESKSNEEGQLLLI